ncbi:hypothetical protein CN383_17315 [Priestia megaterium]|uniref:DUF6612 family protein n=1 Tax=Priestia megaterium TaxID=1404 RepID=UPI000BFA40DE|nr:DUF6612 family protein [Priestia megaterium]PFA99403.1 hypothetical protein CN383_17315 [Priestia megaterium]
MKKIMNTSLAISFALLLSACGMPSSEELTGDVKEAQEKVKNVQVKVTGKEEGSSDYQVNGVQEFDFKSKAGYINTKMNGEELKMYHDGDETLAVAGEESTKVQGEEKKYVTALINNAMELQQNPIRYYQKYDKNLPNEFDVTEKDKEYVLTFNGDKDKKQKIVAGDAKAYYKITNQGSDTAVDLDQIKGKDFSLVVTIDKETNQIKKVVKNQSYSVKVDGKTENSKSKQTYTYTYNQLDNVTKPKVKAKAAAASKDSSTTPSKEKQAAYAKEAGQYVDALIQATVYQNTDQFAAKHPNQQDKKQVEEKGEFQKSSFVEFFETNFKGALSSLSSNITDEQLNEVSSAFLQALSSTKYTIKDAAYSDEDDAYVVQVEIQGFNDASVLAEVMTPLAEKYQAGELSNEQLVNELINGVAKRYREPVELLPAKTVPVHVVRNSEKDYEVLMQDEYLLTFAQQS